MKAWPIDHLAFQDLELEVRGVNKVIYVVSFYLKMGFEARGVRRVTHVVSSYLKNGI